MAVPGTPTGLAASFTDGRIVASVTGCTNLPDWIEFQIATNSGFTTGVQTIQAIILTGTGSYAGFADLAAGSYWVRARGTNGSGSSAYAASVTGSVPARTRLDIVEGASVVVPGATVVSIRSDAADPAVLTIGYSAIGDGTGWTLIDTLPVGTLFSEVGTPADMALVADTAGNLYVFGPAFSATTRIAMKRYARTGVTNAWTAAGYGYATPNNPFSGQAGMQAIAAVFAPGSGVAPVDSIFVAFSRLSAYFAERIMTFTTAAIAAGVGGAIPATYSAPLYDVGHYVGAYANPMPLATMRLRYDAISLDQASRFALFGYQAGVVDLVNGVPTSVAKIVVSGPAPDYEKKTRVVALNANLFALIYTASGALVTHFYSAAGADLGVVSYAGANAQGAAFDRQWDAYYEPVSGVVRLYYIADDSARKLEYVDVSPVTLLAGTAVVVTTTLGAASSTNDQIRIQRQGADERRVFVEAANDLAGVKSLAVYSDTTAEVAPNAPTVSTILPYDAVSAQVFPWAFSDPNPKDSQLSYDLQIQNTATLVNTVDVSNVASSVASRTVAGGTLTNGQTYRYRVRVKDVQGNLSAWSAYSTNFTMSSLGTLTITDPVSDNLAMDSSSKLVVWTYSQTNGYTQTQRRVKVVRTSDSSVLSDTTMQASTTLSYTIAGMLSGVEYRVEVTIVNSNGQTTATATRLITPSYSDPMTPLVVLSTGENFVLVSIDNPVPTGSRPEVVTNDILRRDGGTSDEFVRIGIVGHDESFEDRSVAAGKEYDYQVRGVTA